MEEIQLRQIEIAYERAEAKRETASPFAWIVGILVGFKIEAYGFSPAVTIPFGLLAVGISYWPFMKNANARLEEWNVAKNELSDGGDLGKNAS
ncbi:MAG: hypothetical protein O3A13_10520 [Proteobacteria bacterium]|nr:hypothetical protein [Pseudomonadota bacterium]